MSAASTSSMERFGVNYLDVFFCHRPDPETPLEETCWSMHELILRGKIMYWGTSCYRPSELAEIYAICERYSLHKPVVEQSEYNLIFRERVEKTLKLFHDR
jgi:aryl-alcohol dehydrogenase-like predicted oxidoreductase